ncbi:hypothetical protein SS05631_a48880 (plasmid) [Sinorhizobium sp. CCBAU 05631]|nr:hypothetical protein SS05631_a48880 [Sinorhizobium sp. CCBAU 05631]
MDEEPTHIPFGLMERRHQTIANARDWEGTPGRHRDEFLKGDAVQDEAFPPAPGRDPR